MSDITFKPAVREKVAWNFVDLTGRKFNCLTVVKQISKSGGRVMWECSCDCGKTTIVAAGNLRGSQVKSCGCLRSKSSKERSTTHGMSETPEFYLWLTMIQRCENPNDKAFKNYGGRGIKVCERWHKFENFIADMGRRPTDGLQLDRKDNDGGYCPENCRWVTPTTNCNNRRVTVNITLNGVTKPLAVWAKEFGLGHGTLLYRFNRGWPAEKMLTSPDTTNKIVKTI